MAHLRHHGDHAKLCRNFREQYPGRLNMSGHCRVHAPDRMAIVCHDCVSHLEAFVALNTVSDTLTAAFAARRTRRIGILWTQLCLKTAAHLAVWKSVVISVPLYKWYGFNALYFCRRDVGMSAVITDPGGDKMMTSFPGLRVIVPKDSPPNAGSVATCGVGPEDLTVITHTPGSTGTPNRTLHGRRMLAAHQSTVMINRDLAGRPLDVIGTLASGLSDVVVPEVKPGVRMARCDRHVGAKPIRGRRVRIVFLPLSTVGPPMPAGIQRIGYKRLPNLTADLQAYACSRTAIHFNRRKIAAPDALPMTVTGKVMRPVLRDLDLAEETTR